MNARTDIHPAPAKRRKARRQARKAQSGQVALPAPPPMPPPEPTPARERERPQRIATLPGVPQRRRWLPMVLGFLLLVGLPGALCGHYLFGVAADQYHSQIGFSVRSGTSQQALPAPDLMGAMSGGANPLMSTESYIVYDYLRSQEIVEAVNRDIDLKAIFNAARDDWIFRLGDDASLEDLVHHWQRQVPVVYDTLSGIVTVEVRTFDPVSATAIARSILRHSTDLVNEISRAARDDTVGFAEKELREAVAHLQTIRGQIRAFRDVEQKANAEAQIKIAMGLIASLERDLATARVDLKVAESYTRGDDPRLLRLSNRIEVLEARIEAERARFGDGDENVPRNGKSLADLLGDYEELEVEREFAESAYTTALASLQTAKADARRTQRYLAVHINPTTSQAPQYPERFLLLGLIVASLFIFWALLMLIFTNVRDRV